MITTRARRKRWPAVHTEPLIQLLEKEYPEGIVLTDLAKRTEMSVQSLSASFRNDNMHLSKAEAITKALGYTLRLEYTYSGVYPDDSHYMPSGTAGNLYGLEEYGQRLNRTFSSMANAARCKRDTIAKAIKEGDIMIATLDRIACELSLSIKWVFMEEKRDEKQ